ncbi:MAG: fumarylacetoacetate hydrolase family protein [Eubacteriales bacterium]|nr:fumarylacetoacetate hydrolase family protein [Eubacteriales bacterium]
MEIQRLAAMLLEAEDSVKPIEQLTQSYPELSVEKAYEVQLAVIGERVKSGRKIIGKKIGLTSFGMQKLLGVHEPDYGHLLNTMLVSNGGICSRQEFLKPRVEGEFAFVLNKDLQGPGVTEVDVIRATEGFLPAIEIVDSRIRDWKIKLADTVADNASSARIVLGSRMFNLRDFDLRSLGMFIEKNGELVNSGTGVEVLGNPVVSVAWLANKLSEFGISLKAGEIILSGAITAAVNAEVGDVFNLTFDRLGAVSVKFS